MKPGERSLPVRLLMATRRTDLRARDSWERMASTIRLHNHVTGVLIDRTPNGEAMLHLKDPAAELIADGSLHIIRQGYNTPMIDVLRLWRTLPAQWTIGLHDDDSWSGNPSVPATIDADTTLYAPQLLVSTGASGTAVTRRPWTSQHAIFGAMSPRLQSAYLDYVADAPMSIGGEDLLLLFMAGRMGTLSYNPDFTYIWDASNWQPGSERDAMMSVYTSGFLEDEVDATTAFIIFQSLDRLASCASIREHSSESTFRKSVRHALMSFWPVVNHRGKIVYRVSPRRCRVAMLSTRGMRPLHARIRSTAHAFVSQRNTLGIAQKRNWFEEVNRGVLRLTSIEQIQSQLLPHVREAVAGKVQASNQVEFWDARIRSVACSYRA
jgi:hypothetical protein